MTPANSGLEFLSNSCWIRYKIPISPSLIVNLTLFLGSLAGASAVENIGNSKSLERKNLLRKKTIKKNFTKKLLINTFAANNKIYV